MDSFSVTTHLAREDVNAIQRLAGQRLLARIPAWKRALFYLPVTLLAALLVGISSWLGRHGHSRVGLILVIGVPALYYLHLLVHRRMGTGPSRLLLAPRRFDFSSAGIRIDTGQSTTVTSWSRILEIEQTPNYLLLWVDTHMAHAIPLRDLPAGMDAAAAAERLRRMKAAAPPMDSPTAAGPGADAAMPVPVRAWDPAPAPRPGFGPFAEIGAVLAQLLLVFRIDGERFAGSDRAIGWLGLALLALWIPLDPLLYPEPLTFEPAQIAGLGLVIGGAVALAWILSRLSRPRIEYRRVLLVVTGALVIAMIGSTVVAYFPGDYDLTFLWLCLFAAWATLYFKRALAAITGSVQVRALLVGALAAMVFIGYLADTQVTPSVWSAEESDDDAGDAGEPDDEDVPPEAWARMAEVQFGQQRRIDEEVSKIAAHPAAAGAHVYFVGFAGVGEQHVFANEIDLAASRIAARYGSQDRTLRLVNDERDLMKWPLASAPSLKYALDSLGHVMGADDVLFLAVSSHGGADGSIAVSNLGTVPASISAVDLADALRESGIRWKVIVISACYAGAFIDALEDDHTIVLAAAAKDRTSFGCSDDRDYTYFGEALYRDALPRAHTLREAFEAARTLVAKREKAEGVEPSNPQAFYGAAMERKLAGM